MNPKSTLCLIMDIQTRLVPAMHEAGAFVTHCKRLLHGLKVLDVPFFVTEQYPKGLGKTVETISNQLGGCPVLEKTQFSALLPPLSLWLEQHDIQTVIVIGAETHICVLQTVRDLRQKGLNVVVPIECVASRNEQNRLNGLHQIAQYGATVSNIESILFELLGDASHPQFKAISKLIQ